MLDGTSATKSFPSRAKHKRAFRPAGFFVLRTPLLSFDQWLSWGEQLSAPRRLQQNGNLQGSELEQALHEDRARLRADLRKIVQLPLVRQALFIASPSLHSAIDLWLANPCHKRARKLEHTLVRYFSRMSGRATPFGLFAGCTLGMIDECTALRLASQNRYRSVSSLDVGFLYGLTEPLKKQTEVMEQLRLWPNPTLYTVAGRLRYPEVRVDTTHYTRSYQLSEVEPSPYIKRMLEPDVDGASMPQRIAALRAFDQSIGAQEARQFLELLIENQLLVSELEPPVTGREPLVSVIDVLGQLGSQECYRLREALRHVQGEFQLWDRLPLGVSPASYEELVDPLRALSEQASPARLVQVDLCKPATTASLGHQAIDEIVKAVLALHRISVDASSIKLKPFRDEFKRRYQDQEVSLAQVLDEEFGIGFDTVDGVENEDDSWLLGLPIPTVEGSQQIAWSAKESLLYKKLCQALHQGDTVIALTPEDIDAMEAPDRKPLPAGFAASVALAAGSNAELNNGKFQVLLHGTIGPTGAEFLGRFCHGDAQLRQQVQFLLAQLEQKNPEVIYAELVHLPQGRSGNVLCRPLLRRFHIPYCGRTEATAEDQIPVNDLMVSVVGERIVLRSKRWNREVIPRLTSAHHAATVDLSLYRFLCALQYQDCAVSLSWQWGGLREAPFLPRVVFGKTVFQRATWNLDATELQMLKSTKAQTRAGNASEIYSNVQKLREKRRLPRHVVLIEEDKSLPVDLDNIMSIEALLHYAAQRKTISLVEQFPTPQQLCVNSPEGRFVHELIVPFIGNADFVQCRYTDLTPSVRELIAVESSLQQGIQRAFLPGSEWLYVKLYGPPRRMERVLCDVIYPAIETARTQCLIDDWFFIRYQDPHEHLRLRFHGNGQTLLERVWPMLQQLLQPLLQRGEVQRVQLDTYDREVERYGGDNAMAEIEHFFCHDSEAMIHLVQLYLADTPVQRSMIAMLNVHRLLCDLGLDLETRHVLVRATSASLKQTFGVQRPLEKALGLKFRALRGKLSILVEPGGIKFTKNAKYSKTEQTFILHAQRILAQRTHASIQLRTRLEQLQRHGTLTQSLSSIAGSLAHMSINRLMRRAAPAEEWLVCEFLSRLYHSQLVQGVSEAL